MLRRTFLKALGLSAACGMSAGAHAATGSVAGTIVELDRRLNHFILTRNVQAASELYDDEFLLTVSGGGFKTKADMLADIGNPALFLDVCETTDIAVRVRGRTAVLTGRLLQAGRINDRPFSSKLRVTDTWVQTSDDRWLLLAGHASPEKAPAQT